MSVLDDAPLIRALSHDSISPGTNPEFAWLAARPPGSTVYMLHVADRPEGSPEGLRAALGRQLSDPYDGFGWSRHGLPELRSLLETRLPEDEGWAASGNLRLSVAWTGTGSAIFDFARMIAHRFPRPAAILLPEPGWSYATRCQDALLEPIGYVVPVDSPTGPTEDSLQDALRQCRARDLTLAAILVNAQHNPTGSNWSPQFLDAVADLALTTGAFLVVDNAFFGLTASGIVPTSAVQQLATIADRGCLCYVRSLSKQYGCNSWSLGAIAAEESLLNEFSDRWRGSREDPCGMRLQAAMAAWLQGPEPAAYTAGRRDEISSNRETLRRRLLGAGFLPSEVVAHGGAPYAMLRIPGSKDAQEFRKAVFMASGVIGAVVTERSGQAWLKLFLGRNKTLFSSACSALADARQLWLD